jgi:hypothetical protein
VTATELTFFTATGFYYDLESPATSGVTNADQFNGLTGGYITFTPRVPTGFTILISGLDLGSGNSGSTSISLAPVTGRVMGTIVNGSPVWELCTINSSDTPGIQLLANSTPISTYLTAKGIQSGALIYDVSFTEVTFAGNPQSITPFAFVAPTTTQTICITDPAFETIPYV